MLVERFLHGFSYGASTTAVATIVTSSIPREHKGEGVGYFMLSSTLGTAIGPFAGMALTQAFGMTAVFASCVATATLCLVSFAFFRVQATPSNAKTTAARRSARFEARGLQAFVEPTALPIAFVAGIVFSPIPARLRFYPPTRKRRAFSLPPTCFSWRTP